VTSGVGAALWSAVFALVVGSVIGLFCYLRVIVVMSEPPAEGTVSAVGIVSAIGGTALAILTLAPFWLGIYPSLLVSLIRLTALQVGNR
jgi:NADH-quinone oxidoreductase subunit N